MAIVSVSEVMESRSAKIDRSSRGYKRVFQVVSNDPSDDALEIAQANGIPVYDSVSPNHEGVFVSDIQARPKSDDGLVWEVDVSYSPPDAAGGGSGGDPVSADPVVSFSFMMRQQVLENAYSLGAAIPQGADRGNPTVRVVNQPGNIPFDPPAMIEDSVLVILVTLNKGTDTFTPDYITQYMNTINALEITVAGVTMPPFTGWIRDIKANPTTTPTGDAYWQVQFEILYDPQTWLKKILNTGVFEEGNVEGSSSAPPEYRKILDTDGEPVREPVPLSLTGQRLGRGDPGVYLEFHALWEASWAQAGLPSDLPDAPPEEPEP